MKTHLAIGGAFALFLVSHVSYKFSFLFVTLIISLLPDIDASHSYMGHKWYFRPLQFFVKHRGLFHSFIFLAFITLMLVLFLPIVSLPFFLGYSSHLMLDSFTIEGIYPFYPFKKRIFGSIKTGGKNEIILLIIITLISVAMIITKVFGMYS